MLAESLLQGAVIGGEYAVVRPLGQGGMGAVYLAEQRSTGKLRALKVMHREIAPDASMQRRFEQEAKVGGLVKSGHVVEVIAAGVDAGLPFLVMELLEGEDLRKHLAQRGRLPPSEVGALFEQLSHGVGAAHAAGIVHRDLKPENIFLARSSRAGSLDAVVKILDFGIAKLAQEAGTRATAAIGSPLWMAPEQTTPGPVSPAADVWALGLIAYELLTGEHFWRSASLPTATPMHLLREIVLDPIPPASQRGGPWLPLGFDAWFQKCLARAPTERYANATELWSAMQEFLPAAGAVASRPLARTDPFAPTAMAPVDSVPPRPIPATDTPLAVAGGSVHPRSGAAIGATASSRFTSSGWLAVALGLAGMAGGVWLSRRSAEPAVSPIAPALGALAVPPLGALPTAPAIPTVPAVPAVVPPPMPGAAAVATPVPPGAPVASRAAQEAPSRPAGLPPAAKRPPALPDGFEDPHDRARQDEDVDGPRVLVVRGRHVRILTRIVSNASNVVDSVVRGAMDHSSWQYSRCYEQSFENSKDFTDGTVAVAFDIQEQLPRRMSLVSSTFASSNMTDCVVRTATGQTINAAGKDGAGHVVYALRFVVMD